MKRNASQHTNQSCPFQHDRQRRGAEYDCKKLNPPGSRRALSSSLGLCLDDESAWSKSAAKTRLGLFPPLDAQIFCACGTHVESTIYDFDNYDIAVLPAFIARKIIFTFADDFTFGKKIPIKHLAKLRPRSVRPRMTVRVTLNARGSFVHSLLGEFLYSGPFR